MADIQVQGRVPLRRGDGPVFVGIEGRNVDSPLPPLVSFRIMPRNSQGQSLPEITGSTAHTQARVHRLGDPAVLLGGTLEVRVAVIDFDAVENRFAVIVTVRQEQAGSAAFQDRQEFAFTDPQRLIWTLAVEEATS